jgi:K+-sensing histidine kinase KdpD
MHALITMKNIIITQQGIYKYLYLIFIAGALVLFWIINVTLFIDNPGFIDIAPHPYLVVVIFISALYGYAKGMISVGIVSLVYLICLMFHIATVRESFSRFFQYSYFNPFIIFLVFGTIIGMITDRYRKYLQRAKKELKENKERLDELYEEIKIFQTQNNHLKTKLLDEKELITTLYNIAKKLSTLEIDDLYKAILDVGQEVIDAEKGAVFIKQGDKLVLCASLGYKSYEEPKIKQEILKTVIEKKSALSLKDFTPLQKKGKEDIFLCGPLCLGSMGEVIGILVVQELAFIKYNPLTIRTFSLICDWASVCIGNAYMFKSAKDLAEQKQLGEQLGKMMEALSHKYKGPFHFGTASTQIIENMEAKIDKGN